MEISNVCVGIVIICLLVGMVAKNIKKIGDDWIPSIVGVAGGVLGLVCFYTIAGFPAADWMDAVAVGIVSGLASTGAHQAIMQKIKNKVTMEDVANE